MLLCCRGEFVGWLEGHCQRLCLRSGGTLKHFSVPRDQTLNEDNTLNLHQTPPLLKHLLPVRAVLM